jgi:chromosome segregation protein
MYLKQLDVTGFKSFADRTKLTFEPGLIAIVGPNGCGKSNVSDAIRWVLGEQRPTALRCSKLADVVFNGTDTRKPLGLAEVSITFADCEKELGTDYNEVTITRRVYRDGTGEYFINKQASRLKDVQRLFMNTGIGTSSYSVMAQGQIDAILSSRPEDRRGIFEEAAGIMKFKADRKDALRKIDQTEQNLLREADVLREMKRQIASLQRQVGKAQKYKELRDKLRDLDIYVSKQKIHSFDLELEQNAANRQEIEKAILEAQEIVSEAESTAQRLHGEIHELEERLQSLASQQAAAESEYRRAHEVIGVNASRIEEYRAFAERDKREIAQSRQLLEEVKMQSESLGQKTKLLTDSLEAAKCSLIEAEETFTQGQRRIEELRISLQSARAEAVQCDREASEKREELMKLRIKHEQAVIDEEESVSAVISPAGEGGVRFLDCIKLDESCRESAEAALGGLYIASGAPSIKASFSVNDSSLELRVPKSSFEAGTQNADLVVQLENLAREVEQKNARREELSQLVASGTEELQRLEISNIEESQRLTERRIAASQLEQELSFVGQQNEQAMLRREELERVVESREEGIRGYEESISRLTDESGDLLSQLDELKEKAASFNIAMDDERVKRAGMMERIAAADQAVAERRAGLDQARDFRSKLDVQAAESTMRRQNVYDHLQDEYGLFADAVMRESDPKWKNGVVPPMEELEGTVARLQSEIAALGPVNMVAIDECRELEERYAREKAQEEDLLAAKAQLVELINNLNLTSGDMFKTTFEQANRNFQTMFTKLFGGGEARLVLLENSEDPLECGIDIIARPPGKRPQSVTLLSGGERTMTAVALLFSIFMIKPAPFCMLDELDAALDDANIGRFVEQLKEFLVQSQFLIITHNQHTIAGSDLVYGVSQQEKGVSRVISMKLSDLGVKAKK